MPYFGHLSKALYSLRYMIQSFRQECILSTSTLRGHNNFLAAYVVFGNSLSSGNISPINSSNEVKILSLHPFLAFKLYNLKIADNFVNFVQPENKGTFELLHKWPVQTPIDVSQLDQIVDCEDNYRAAEGHEPTPGAWYQKIFKW